jgi:hypothetical protein
MRAIFQDAILLVIVAVAGGACLVAVVNKLFGRKKP